jgi:hypothetical protein
MAENKVILVEIGGSHDECLLTQMIALHNNGKQVILIATPEVIDRNPHFDQYLSEAVLVKKKDKGKGEVARLVWLKIKQREPELVVFNTAQGGTVRNVCVMALASNIPFAGIIHTTRKLEGSFTQRLINWKIKKYLLLSEFLHRKVTPPGKVKTDYFYPIEFYKGNQTLEKEKPVQIGIIGGVERRRKDLDGFIQMLKNLKRDDVQFVFIGKSDAEHDDVKDFNHLLAAEELEDKVRLFSHFLSQDEFDAHLRNTDLILPLVHPNTPSADQYFKNQISGAANVAFGYHIPMLIHKAYGHIEEMNAGSTYYELDSFNEQLDDAIRRRNEKAERLKELYKAEEQQGRYFEFLFPN